MSKRIASLSFVFCALVLVLSRTEAYQFTPTDAEWVSWPGHCKAMYAWTNIGMRSKFANRVSLAQKTDLAQWKNSGIVGVHHYCAGTIWLNRAKLESDSRNRRFMLSTAQRETQFTLQRSNQNSPLFVNVAIQMASIVYEQGDIESALQLFQNLILTQPQNDVPYSATAVVLRKLGHLERAKAILLQGHEATQGNSAEICYNLGLVSLELGELDDAVAYASLAYEKGYPLPGLRVKLEKLGRF